MTDSLEQRAQRLGVFQARIVLERQPDGVAGQAMDFLVELDLDGDLAAGLDHRYRKITLLHALDSPGERSDRSCILPVPGRKCCPRRVMREPRHVHPPWWERTLSAMLLGLFA